jgi:20S proteasome alpha/beta subunit
MKTHLFDGSFERREPWTPIFLQSPELTSIIAPMTVGIAAICDNRKAIVLAADKLMTIGEANLTMDTESHKVMPIAPHVWVAITGTIQDSEYAQERFRHSANLLSVQSVLQIAKRLRKACEHMRARQIEERILRPIWNISYKEYNRACLRSPTPSMVNDVLTRILGFQYALTLLVCGFDDDGAHIYRVNNATVNSHKGIGFHAIGYGETIATATLCRRGRNFIDESIAETLYRVYEAKRAAEHTGLVGKGTDMVLLTKGCEPEMLSEDLIAECRRVYKKYKPMGLADDEISAINSKLPPRPTL